MQAFATACTGFLLAVLWFDLMHDVLARGDGPTPEGLETIRRYYRRVTTDASPMNRLVVAAMLGLLVTLVAEVVGDSVPAWAGLASLAWAVPPIALSRDTVRRARRLAGRDDARVILGQHVACFFCMSVVLVLQLASLA